MDTTLPQYRMSYLGYERGEQNGSEIPGGSRPPTSVVKLMLKRVLARQQGDRIAIGRKASDPSGSLSTLIILITWADCRNEDDDIAARGDGKLHKLLREIVVLILKPLGQGDIKIKDLSVLTRWMLFVAV